MSVGKPLLALMICLMILSLIGVRPAYANVPSVKVSARFDASNLLITLDISHQSPTQNHYVDWVEADVDGTITRYTQTPQATEDFTATINLGNHSPSSVKVRANCNLHGPSGWVSLATYQLTIQEPEGSGSTKPPAGTYTYYTVTTVTVTATPDSGWKLDHWTLDGNNIGSDKTYSVKMDASHQLKAFFTSTEPQAANYTLTIMKPEGQGSTNPTTANYTYSTKTTVTVTATPATGWALDHWLLDEANIGGANPYIVNMNESHKLKPVFTQKTAKTYALNIQVKGTGSTNPGAGTANYDEGANAVVTATPASGWKLDHWELDGSNVGGANPYTVKMNANHQLTIVFTSTEAGSTGGIPAYPLGSVAAGMMICIALLTAYGHSHKHR
ncbi:hypothetical protein A3K78_07445 [Candidatus Bathyarchaeota archaeon RBG_13_52_12]|nr:MAG: hypothetical protein A3K78_07445 [Candidatus Bathyarchaeota archaeon RBG_13_52_12]